MGLFDHAGRVFGLALLIRLVLFSYGLYQDATSFFKYTDIDYYVFTDAAANVAAGQSPYLRSTYRYTPLLAWLLVPTSFGPVLFHSGKLLFALFDLLAGWFITQILVLNGTPRRTALKYASIWLLNPMVANISTRGSSEALLCTLVLAIIYTFKTLPSYVSGTLLGLAVHFKIYPFIYGPSFVLALAEPPLPATATMPQILNHAFSSKRVNFVTAALVTFTILNLTMFSHYGQDFLHETFFYHLVRIDHRHNFSPYQPVLYLASQSGTSLSIESLAFVPQLLLAVVILPYSLAKVNLPACLFTQTLAFVTFNKVATSQYFLWYLCLLPILLPGSKLLRSPFVGIAALSVWVLGQALWLWQGFELEFLGRSTFVPGLWLASLFFFVVNCGITVLIVYSVGPDPIHRKNA